MADDRPAGPSPRGPGWEDPEVAQRRHLAGLPLADKLAWLEEAQRLVDHLRSQRATLAGGGSPTAPPAEDE